MWWRTIRFLRAAAAYAEVYRLAGKARSRDAEIPAPLAQAQPAGTAQPPWPSLSVLGFTLDLVTLDQAADWVVETAGAATPATALGAAGAAAVSTSVSDDERPPGGERRLRRPTALAVSFNPELVMRAQRDPGAAAALLEADLCYPDGVGAVWAAGRQGARSPERVAGIDLAARVLEEAAAWACRCSSWALLPAWLPRPPAADRTFARIAGGRCPSRLLQA